MLHAQAARQIEDRHRLAVQLDHLGQVRGAQRQRLGGRLMEHVLHAVQGQPHLDLADGDEEGGDVPQTRRGPGVFENPLDQRQELLRPDGLGQVGLGAVPETGLGAELLAGDDDHRDATVVRIVLQVREHLVAVHLRHGKIEQDGRGVDLLHLGQRLAAVHRGADGVVPRERRLLECEHRFRVVDEQEVREAHTPDPTK